VSLSLNALRRVCQRGENFWRKEEGGFSEMEKGGLFTYPAAESKFSLLTAVFNVAAIVVHEAEDAESPAHVAN
jgi:hypothetical protein